MTLYKSFCLNFWTLNECYVIILVCGRICKRVLLLQFINNVLLARGPSTVFMLQNAY